MKHQQVFISMPYNETSRSIWNAIISASREIGVEILRADEYKLVNTSFPQAIYEAITKASLLVADISNANPNVMYEVGFAQAQRKPLILIASGSRAIPFELTGIQVLIYDLANIELFVKQLSHSIQRALEQPKEFVLPDISVKLDKRQNVFISYSHRDREFVDRLLIHLKPLEREGLICLWVDTLLRTGDRWKKEIEKALSRANIAILIVSADFLASDFITDNELPPILRDAEEKGTRIVPLIVKPCRFTRDKNLRHFQAINNPAESLILLNEGEQEKYYDAVAAEVEGVLKRR